MSKRLIDRPTEIRDDEKLNNSKLFEYLSNIIDLDIESFDILQFPSGYSNLTYLIKSNEKEYVLRKPPHGAKIKSGHDMSREFKVLSSLKVTIIKPLTQFTIVLIRILLVQIFI